MIKTIEEVLLIDFTKSAVVIVGNPASGKTYLANKILNHGNCKHKNIYHTDDYIRYGWVDSMYRLLKDVISDDNPKIIEGVQGFRLLRKGSDELSFCPDYVIYLKSSEDKLRKVYGIRGDNDKINGALKLCKANSTVWSKYIANSDKLPTIIEIDNNWD